IVAVDRTDYISSPSMRRRIMQDSVISVKPGSALDVERVLTLKPDAVFYYEGAGGEDASFSLLRKKGIRLIPVNNYKEQHPLGRAEWLRYVARIFGMASAGDSLFNAVAGNYEQIRTSARNSARRPTVLCNAPFNGVWDQPQRNNYMATMIRDAGGIHLWDEAQGSGTVSLQPESVLLKARDADVWINCNDYMELKALEGEDSRLTQFKAFRNQRIYAANAGKTLQGAIPFWEQGVVRPDLILQDLRRIFSSASARDSFYFYRKLP
ncbi:MAG: ABC transporter substrate-binding protein, partial [Bacteroidetes bacterium]|nr:ABC transporter substrate-binding protein [Bacteroidota bacterium]